MTLQAERAGGFFRPLFFSARRDVDVWSGRRLRSTHDTAGSRNMTFGVFRSAGMVALAALALGAACARTPADRPPPVPTSLLVVTIDTLRADRVGVYGAANVQTPNMDRLAREGAWAPQATVHVPLTRPSHVSLFTGIYPAEHGIRDNLSPPLGGTVPLLAELFQRSGFSTAAFVASAVLDRQSGLARGFDVYSDRFEQGADRRSGDAVVAEAIGWLKGRTRFFAWVHLYDVHAPYHPPDSYAVQYAGRPYDGAVAWSDELVGRLVSALREAGTLDNTLVIVTSDHGEGLGDHGEDVHGYFVYEATLRVPLVLRGPGVNPGTRVDVVARTIDLFPTILELMRLDVPVPKTSGRSLAPALGGRPLGDEPSFAESLVPLIHYGWSDLRAVRDGRWKYILAPRPELYDLQTDPRELTNVADAEPSRARAMRSGLQARLRDERTSARTETAAAGISPELLERLGALGYVSPGGPSDTKSAGADPKDKLDEYKALSMGMQEGLVALRAGRPAETVDRIRAVARRGVDSFEVHYYLGRAYTALRRWRDAAAEYERAAGKLPSSADAWRGLGESRVELRDWRGAEQAFSRLVSIAPKDAMAQMQLGEVYRDMGRMADAARAMRAALDLDSRPAQYWNALGTVLGAGREMRDAERAFGEAATREPDNPLYAYNRGLALQQLGRQDEAVTELRRAAALGSAPAREWLARLPGPRRR
jgi:choline-sulfatase